MTSPERLVYRPARAEQYDGFSSLVFVTSPAVLWAHWAVASVWLLIAWVVTRLAY